MSPETVKSSKEKKKTTANISFKDAKEMQNVLSDVEIGEEITITITGKTTSLNMYRGNGYEDASIGLDVIKINGSTKKANEDKKEMEDMTEG